MRDAPSRPSKKWKTAIIVWLSIYPLITLIFAAFGRQIMQINPIPVRTLLLTLILVPLMVFLIIPFAQKLFASWLEK